VKQVTELTTSSIPVPNREIVTNYGNLPLCAVQHFSHIVPT